jgi:esterase
MQKFVTSIPIIALLTCMAPAKSEPANPKWPIPDGVKWIEVNGYPMSYQDNGEGVPIVLVHGAVNDYRVWAGTIPALRSSLRVINVSLRHFYPERWDAFGSDFSIVQHGRDVAQFIENLHLGQVHLLGHSRGGAVAVEVAKSHPELIRTLILEDGSIQMPVEETPDAKQVAEFGIRLMRDLQNGLKSGDKERATVDFVEGLNGRGSWASVPQATREILYDNIFTALGDDTRPLTTCDDVRKFQFPVLLMTAENSPKKYEFFYNEMRKCAEFSPSVVIPKAAHGMHRQNPEAFHAAILEFVKAH